MEESSAQSHRCSLNSIVVFLQNVDGKTVGAQILPGPRLSQVSLNLTQQHLFTTHPTQKTNGGLYAFCWKKNITKKANWQVKLISWKNMYFLHMGTNASRSLCAPSGSAQKPLLIFPLGWLQPFRLKLRHINSLKEGVWVSQVCGLNILCLPWIGGEKTNITCSKTNELRLQVQHINYPTND